MATTVFDTPTDSKQDKSDNTLTTTAKTVVGAINELDSNLAAKKELVVTQKTDANDCIPSGNKTYEVFVLPDDALYIPEAVGLFVQAFKSETNYVTQIATSMAYDNKMYIRHFTIGDTIPDWEEMALDTNVSAKRTTILTSLIVRSDTSILPLSNGAYQVADNNLNTSYIPEKWGTLVVNKSGTTYGEFTFVGTSGNVYVRHANGVAAWHGNGWVQLAPNSNLGSPSSASAVTGDDAFSKINTLNNNVANKANRSYTNWGTTISGVLPSSVGFLMVNNDLRVQIWLTSEGISICTYYNDGTSVKGITKAATGNSITFSGTDPNGNAFTITKNNKSITITKSSNGSMVLFS